MNPIEFMVMTINVGGAKQVRNQQLNLKEFASTIVQRMPPSVKPDITAVQESHQVWHEKNLCLEKSEELSKILGNSYRSYFSPYLDSDHHAHHKKWKRPMYKGFLRVKQGNAIITNKDTAQWPWDFPPESYPGYNKCAPLSTQISRAALFSTGDRNTEPRSLMVVPLSVGGISLYFIATHLATLKGEDRHNNRTPQSVKASDVRLAQVHEILKIVDNLRKAECEKGTNHRPIILAGDFNAQPDSPEINALEQTFVRLTPRWYNRSYSSVWTHAGHKICIDHIFYNDPRTILTPTDCFVLPPHPLTEVLDHLPVVATFEIDQDL